MLLTLLDSPYACFLLGYTFSRTVYSSLSLMMLNYEELISMITSGGTDIVMMRYQCAQNAYIGLLVNDHPNDQGPGLSLCGNNTKKLCV